MPKYIPYISTVEPTQDQIQLVVEEMGEVRLGDAAYVFEKSRVDETEEELVIKAVIFGDDAERSLEVAELVAKALGRS